MTCFPTLSHASIQQVKSLPFDMTWKPKKGTSFGAKPARMDHYKEYPPPAGVTWCCNRSRSRCNSEGGGGRYSYWYVRAKGYGFLAVLIGINFDHFWSGIGYDLCTLVLNWVCFFRRSYFSVISFVSFLIKAHKHCLQHWSDLGNWL